MRSDSDTDHRPPTVDGDLDTAPPSPTEAVLTPPSELPYTGSPEASGLGYAEPVPAEDPEPKITWSELESEDFPEQLTRKTYVTVIDDNMVMNVVWFRKFNHQVYAVSSTLLSLPALPE